MTPKFISIHLEDLLPGEPLPATIYLCIDTRFVTFRAEGDVIDPKAYERLELKKITSLFIQEQDLSKLQAWKKKVEPELVAPPTEAKDFPKVREEVQRQMFDIFKADGQDIAVRQVLDASKKLVAEVMKFPYSVQSLTQLQTHSKGVVYHSINVSILSVYLALQMGYSHQVILQNIAIGGLLHDLGKTKVRIDDSDSPETVDAKLKEHPTLGARILESKGEEIPKEVLMIVSQHHECHDGTGYPKKVRGSAIYDLSRIVAITNTFDNLVAQGSGTLVERQRNAILKMDQVLYHKFDPEKHDKALRILKLGV